jgi:hypothetical protein
VRGCRWDEVKKGWILLKLTVAAMGSESVVVTAPFGGVLLLDLLDKDAGTGGGRAS